MITQKFTARSEVGFIALAPVMLGFQPTNSLVMMTVDSFHARIDLPDPEDIEECVDALLEPAKKHGVGRLAFLIFDDGDHGALKTALVDRFTEAGIPVLAALEVAQDKY